MLKYLYCKEVFTEVPDEISLALSISNCQIRCEKCNQKELWQDEGTVLSVSHLDMLLRNHRGITCVLFMGSGNFEYNELNKLAEAVKKHYLKVAIYLGEDEIPKSLNLNNIDYIKIGHWEGSLGGLDSSTTNQVLYKVYHTRFNTYTLTNINSKFIKQ